MLFDSGSSEELAVVKGRDVLTLSDWFNYGRRASADGVALRIGQRAWSYSELHAVALALAGAVLEAQGKRDAPVGVLGARSIGCYAGILAGVFAGVPVVPLSPSFPISRTAAMLQAAGVEVLIVDKSAVGVARKLTGTLPGLRVVFSDAASLRPYVDMVSGSGDANTLDRLEPVRVSNTAYILYTSGSTGAPKGVPITHANMDHFIRVSQDRYRFTTADVFSQTFDCTFDLAMFDLFMAWSSGATVVSTPPQAFANLREFVDRNRLSVWFSVPAAVSLARRMANVRPGDLESLRWSLFCGEPLLERDAVSWREFALNSTLENLYGPTELTIACSAYRWSDDRSPSECVNGVVPIGRISEGSRYMLIDERGSSTAVEGELCVSGPQMFPGYLDSQHNRERFVRHAGVQWYRTGDLVRDIGDPGLAYIGRTDHQVKIRGYRVELAEIEKHVRDVAGVASAVVVGVPSEGNLRLAAWYVGTPALEMAVRQRLVDLLPEFMVPHWIWHISEFPQSVNRKTDRKLLAAMALERAEVRSTPTVSAD